MATLIIGVDYSPRTVRAVAEAIGQYRKASKEHGLERDIVACGPDNIPPSFWEGAKEPMKWSVVVLGNPAFLPEWIWKDLGKLELSEVFVMNSGLSCGNRRPIFTDYSCTDAGGITKFPVSMFAGGDSLSLTETVVLWHRKCHLRKPRTWDMDFHVERLNLNREWSPKIPNWVTLMAGKTS